MGIHQTTDNEMSESAAMFIEVALSKEALGWAYGHSFRATKNHEDAEDLSQEILFNVFKYAEAYDPSKSRPNTYITKIIKNRISKFISSKRRKIETLSYNNFQSEPIAKDCRTTNNPLENLLGLEKRFELSGKIMCAIETLSRRQKDVTILTYFQGLNSRKVGQQIGISQSAVATHLMVARRKLRIYLEPLLT